MNEKAGDDGIMRIIPDPPRRPSEHERMDPQKAEAEARLIEYYAKALNAENQKDLLYPNNEISAREYEIADDCLTGLSHEEKGNFARRVRAFVIKKILLERALPASQKIEKFEKKIGL